VNAVRNQYSQEIKHPQDAWLPTEPYCRILVVDDDPSIKALVATALLRVGYGVTTANDGESGWEAICSEPFDLLITDYSMPRLNGVELLKRLRQRALALPAILMSANMSRDVSEIIELVSQGGALHKPFRLEDLYFKVGLILDNSHSPKTGNIVDPTDIFRNHGRAKRLIRQEAIDLRLRQLAKNLLLHEANTFGQEDGAPPLAEVCAKMEKYLKTISGVVGFRSIIARALMQSQTEFDWLRHVKVSPLGALECIPLAESLVPPSEILRGEADVVSRILSSLVSLLGESVARACLDELWQEAP